MSTLANKKHITHEYTRQQEAHMSKLTKKKHVTHEYTYQQAAHMSKLTKKKLCLFVCLFVA